MSKDLEKFVKDNRDEFDKFEPGPVVWHNIQQQLKRPPEKKGILITMKTLRWSAAAAIAILVGTGAYYFIQKNNQTDHPATTVAKQDNPTKTNDPLLTKDNQLPANSNVSKDNNQDALATDDYNEEMYHYAKLVEMKQNEIKKITKDEPLLYQQFAGDINKLDSTFHTLKQQLPKNPNREQILEAMLRNLQLQTNLLNQQLNIIKQINHVKQSEYEKADKSI